MSSPANELDKFASYTYHFELHASSRWDPDLTRLQTWDANANTTAYESNDTLLINTRKDAHQVIDHVQYVYRSPMINPTMTPVTMASLKFTVTEPGGISFIEKLVNHMAKYNVSYLGGMIFVLKVFFVGRYTDNTIETLPATIIPCLLKDISAEFTHQGGIYVLEFDQASTGITNSKSQFSTAFNYSSKAVVVRAKTVTEALQELENNLNENYRLSIASVTAEHRPIRYKINLDPNIRGDLSVINNQNYSPSSPGQLSFPPNKPILDMIKQVLMSSREVNDMIAESKESLKNDLHEGVKIPTFSGNYRLEDNEAVVEYNIYLYTGGNYLDDMLTFDFYFAEPGKNVDIIDFDIKLVKMLAWLQDTMRSVAYWTNQDAQTLPAESRQLAANAIHANTTRHRLSEVQQEVTRLDMLTKDVLPPSASPRQEITNWIASQSAAAPSARMAFQTYAEFHGAVEPQVAFTIRGNYDLLLSTVITPDGKSLGFGMERGMWLKVNIFDREGRPFFYTGNYLLMTVENYFSDGKFTQKLVTLMSDKPGTSS